MFFGITGQTGAGKSVVCDELKLKGCVIIDADKIARITVESPECVAKLTKAFGERILTSDGTLDRSALAKIAFSSRESTDILNGITHPAIVEKMLKAAEQAENQGKTVVFDAPQLYESGLDRYCETVFAICADESVRKTRIIERDGISGIDADRRMSAGLDTQIYIDRGAYVFDNSGATTPKEIADKIYKIIERMKTV